MWCQGGVSNIWEDRGETNGHQPDFRRQRGNQPRLPHRRAQPCYCVHVAAQCPECLTLKSLNYTRYSTPLPPLPRPCTPFLLSVNLMTPALPKKQLSWWISSRRAASFCTGSLSQSVLEHGPDTSSSVRQDIAELSVQAQCVYSSICQRTLCQSHPVAFGMTLLYARTGNSFPGTLISIGLLIF